MGTPSRQRQTVEAVAETWERRPWPADGLLGYYVYTGHDSFTLLPHSRWVDEQADAAYVATRRQERVDEVDTAVPGYRTAVAGPVPVLPQSRSGRPGGAGARLHRDRGCGVRRPRPERQRAWVDAVVEALEGEPNPHPGGICAHFHLGTDGTRVLNYAEWESAQAHLEALAAPGDGIGSGTARWERVQTWPGLKSSTVGRYDHGLGLLPD